MPRPKRNSPPARSPEDRNKLIEPLLPPTDWVESYLVRHYRKQFNNPQLRDELRQLGYEGFLYAADYWIPRSQLGKEFSGDLIDLDKSTKREKYEYLSSEGFFVYAQNPIRVRIRQHLKQMGRPVHVPLYLFTPECDYVLPVSSPVDSEEVQTCIQEGRLSNPLATLLELEPLRLVEVWIERLAPREKRVISAYFGLVAGERQMTLEELRRELGVSQERVRQIKNEAIQKLIKMKKESKYDECNIPER